MMKLTVFGATGGTGRQIVTQAIAAGHTVTALVRDATAVESRPSLQLLSGDCRDLSSISEAICGQDAVLCALGGRPWRRKERVCSTAMLNIVPAMQKHGVRRLLAISTFGASDTRALVDLLPRVLVFGIILRSEVADKEAMEAQLAASDLDWTAVRVGVLNDGPRTGAYRARDDGTFRGMGTISRADVADFMLAELKNGSWLRRRPGLRY